MNAIAQLLPDAAATTFTPPVVDGMTLESALAAIPFATHQHTRYRLRRILIEFAWHMIHAEAPTVGAGATHLASAIQHADQYSGDYGRVVRAIRDLSTRRGGIKFEALRQLLRSIRDVSEHR